MTQTWDPERLGDTILLVWQYVSLSQLGSLASKAYGHPTRFD